MLPVRRLLLRTLVMLAFFASLAFPQSRSIYDEDVRGLLEGLKRQEFLRLSVNLLADRGAKEAIPQLEAKFAEINIPPTPSGLVSEEAINKIAVASALVRLGNKKPEYWDFLAVQAEIAADDRTPFPIKLDAQGNMIPKEIAPDFRKWAESKNLSVNDAASEVFYKMPSPLRFLAVTADPRGIPILRKALASPNYLAQNAGAEGLARLQDKDSIKLIIDACEKRGPQFAEVIARALVYFDDSEAVAASERFIQNREMLTLTRQHRAQYGVEGLFK